MRPGVPLHVLSHEEEAYLTLVGVTMGLPVGHETLVVDIGGGSSEFCAVASGGLARAAGLRLGSNRLTSRFVRDDPPTADQLGVDGGRRRRDPSGRAAGRADRSRRRRRDRVQPPQGDRRRHSRSRSSRAARLAEAVATLTARPAAETSERFVVNPTRARLLPAGAVIVEALMRRYGVDAVRVSEEGMREGAILVAQHAGGAWRDRLPELAHGWRH